MGRADQLPGIRLRGPGDDVRGRAQLHHCAVPEHEHLIRDLCDHGQIVAHVDGRGALAPDELPEREQHLDLRGDVQCGRRLVEYEQPGIADHRHGRHHALELASADLVRIAAPDGPRVGQVQLLEERHRLRLRLVPGQQALHHRRFRHLQAQGERAVERGGGALRDVGDVPAAYRPALGQGEVEEPMPAEAHAAPRDLASGAGIAHARQGDRRLARARLADQGDHLAGPDLEGDALDDGDRPPPPRPRDDGEVPYPQQGRRRVPRQGLSRLLLHAGDLVGPRRGASPPSGRSGVMRLHSSSGSAASVVLRNQSTSMLTDTVTRAMHRAGKIGA